MSAGCLCQYRGRGDCPIHAVTDAIAAARPGPARLDRLALFAALETLIHEENRGLREWFGTPETRQAGSQAIGAAATLMMYLAYGVKGRARDARAIAHRHSEEQKKAEPTPNPKEE